MTEQQRSLKVPRRNRGGTERVRFGRWSVYTYPYMLRPRRQHGTKMGLGKYLLPGAKGYLFGPVGVFRDGAR